MVGTNIDLTFAETALFMPSPQHLPQQLLAGSAYLPKNCQATHTTHLQHS